MFNCEKCLDSGTNYIWDTQIGNYVEDRCGCSCEVCDKDTILLKRLSEANMNLNEMD